MADHLREELAREALLMAIRRRQPPRGLIHHSDRGVQYASAAYVARLTEVDARVSMAAVGNPYENAKAESFFKTLKREEVHLNHYRTFQEAEANLGRFLADVYTAKRLHSSLGYRPPIEFEAIHAATIGSWLCPWFPLRGSLQRTCSSRRATRRAAPVAPMLSASRG